MQQALQIETQPQGYWLHIGGEEVRDGWTLVNIQDGPGVDVVTSCTDLSAFPDGSVARIYASHILEHLSYQEELQQALSEFYRVLAVGGVLEVSVPDFGILCQLFTHPELNPPQRFAVMRMMFGGQINPYDYHKVGFTFEFLSGFLGSAGFVDVCRMTAFDHFEDTSQARFAGVRISLNVAAVKPHG